MNINNDPEAGIDIYNIDKHPPERSGITYMFDAYDDQEFDFLFDGEIIRINAGKKRDSL